MVSLDLLLFSFMVCIAFKFWLDLCGCCCHMTFGVKTALPASFSAKNWRVLMQQLAEMDFWAKHLLILTLNAIRYWCEMRRHGVHCSCYWYSLVTSSLSLNIFGSHYTLAIELSILNLFDWQAEELSVMFKHSKTKISSSSIANVTAALATLRRSAFWFTSIALYYRVKRISRQMWLMSWS